MRRGLDGGGGRSGARSETEGRHLERRPPALTATSSPGRRPLLGESGYGPGVGGAHRRRARLEDRRDGAAPAGRADPGHPRSLADLHLPQGPLGQIPAGRTAVRDGAGRALRRGRGQDRLRPAAGLASPTSRRATERRVLESGQTVEVEEVVFRGDEARTFLTSLFPLRDGQGGTYAFAGISTDITERKRAAEEAQQAVERRDRFLAMLSHELRTPLGAIVNATEILQPVRDAPPRTSAADVIGRQARHMGRLIDDLLDVGRITRDQIVIDARSRRSERRCWTRRWRRSGPRPSARGSPSPAGAAERDPAGAGRSRPPAPDRQQPAGQRHHPHRPGGRRGDRRRGGGAGAHRGQGHRRRHPARAAAAHLRALLSGAAAPRSPAGRPGGGPQPGPDPGPAARRGHRRAQRGGRQGQHLHPHLAQGRAAPWNGRPRVELESTRASCGSWWWRTTTTTA